MTLLNEQKIDSIGNATSATTTEAVKKVPFCNADCRGPAATTDTAIASKRRVS